MKFSSHRRHSGTPRFGRAGAIGLASLAICFWGAGCAPKQRVPLSIAPLPLDRVEVYVNGERQEQVPSELELRADRDHKVYVKRPGYRPELVVLTTEKNAGELLLTPAQIRIELRERAAKDREVEIDAAPAESAASPRETGP